MTQKKQIETVKREHPEYTRLISAVLRQLGNFESINDINRHGIDGGYGGFVYYSDTHKFAMRNRADIVKLLEDTAEQLGEDVVTMVSGFGVFRHNNMDAEDRRDLYKYLGGGRCEQSQITNLMAWFAGEEVCRWFDDIS